MVFSVGEFERVVAMFEEELLVAVFVVAVFVEKPHLGHLGFDIFKPPPPLMRYGGGSGFSF